MRLAVTIWLAALLPAQQDAGAAKAPQPIDFAKVDRTPPKLPALGPAARFGLFLFGANGERRVWAVLDQSRADGPYDVLYLDRNGDGDLRAADERFAGRAKGQGENATVAFAIGDFRAPGTDFTSKDFTITWTARIGVRFKMLWRGTKVTFGGYGPSHETYAGFGDAPETAPVFVPGWDRPFEFERWVEEPVHRDRDTDFKVFLGNRGDRTGAFAAVDDEFLPAGEYVIATLRYRDADGKAAMRKFELRQRC